ncbi:methyltransferase domain-containing protein [Aquabacter cavernae]|uniref:methyltransferase domain-containing protein n=1 Tax=Aquabacter cavernae TaxID=2496029 RepID=UPI000F8C4A09|nr:methyltransferase domain-containing protein [Aquabacter cavernae]
MSSILTQSSGDPALDRRLEWARAYLSDGEAEAAEGMLADLVAEAPRFRAAWFLLAEAREAKGDTDGAATAYQAVLDQDRQDALGARARLARLGRGEAKGALSPAFVQSLFDQYAPRFDTALREGLAYRGPELLVEALRATVARPAYDRILDLGCGTGLAAPLLAPLGSPLIGVDLSPGMVRQAEALGLYDGLHVADMAAFLAGEATASADLILAADALCYLDDLAPVFSAARRVLRQDGCLAFTVETHDGDGMILRDTLRYAHGAPLVRQALADAGFVVRLLQPAATRTEKGVPVPGLVCVAG